MRVRSGFTFSLGLALLSAACDSPTQYDDSARASLTSADRTVLVGFAQMPGAAEIALIESFGGSVTHQYRYIPFVVATIPESQQAALAAAPGVTDVGENYPLVPFGSRQVVDWGVQHIEAPAAWAAGFRGQGVKVGIFDSGIDVDHPDLPVAGGLSLVNGDPSLDDCNGHGTHVAGIVGARNNGRHTVGVAPAAQLYSMRLSDCAWAGGTVAKMIQLVEWAIDNELDVVNMSFGFLLTGGVVPSPLSPSAAADAAFRAAHQAGIVLIAASGNSLSGVGGNVPYVSYPAAHPDVIAVGATDDADMLSTFSQWGEQQDVTAPGVANLSSYLVGQGLETSIFVRTDNDHELDAIPMLFASQTPKKGITASAIYAGAGSPIDYLAQPCAGRIAVVLRGGPTFAQKAEWARDAGCLALIVHNNQPGTFNGTLGAAVDPQGRPWLPVVGITLDDGLYLKNQIESKPTTTSLFNVPGNLAVFSGTSMASPHAAGVAALVLSRYPAATPAEVRAILQSSADDLGTPGWDPVFGHGRVNARRAVQ